MNRLLSVLRWEATIQFRQGIFYAAAFVTVVWSLIIYWVPDAGIVPVLVSVLFLDLSVFGILFMAGLYYLEKGDRVLEGLVVTPLRALEYLSAKITVLTSAGLFVGVAVTLIVYGTGLNWFWFLVSMLAMSFPLSLMGFVLAARYNGISEYLVPGAIFLAVMQFPLLTYFGIVPPILYLLPSGPGMIFLAAAFGHVPLWQLVFATIYTAALCGGGYVWAQRTFERVIARQVGG